MINIALHYFGAGIKYMTAEPMYTVYKTVATGNCHKRKVA